MSVTGATLSDGGRQARLHLPSLAQPPHQQHHHPSHHHPSHHHPSHHHPSDTSSSSAAAACTGAQMEPPQVQQSHHPHHAHPHGHHHSSQGAYYRDPRGSNVPAPPSDTPAAVSHLPGFSATSASGDATASAGILPRDAGGQMPVQHDGHFETRSSSGEARPHHQQHRYQGHHHQNQYHHHQYPHRAHGSHRQDHHRHHHPHQTWTDARTIDWPQQPASSQSVRHEEQTAPGGRPHNSGRAANATARPNPATLGNAAPATTGHHRGTAQQSTRSADAAGLAQAAESFATSSAPDVPGSASSSTQNDVRQMPTVGSANASHPADGEEGANLVVLDEQQRQRYDGQQFLSSASLSSALDLQQQHQASQQLPPVDTSTASSSSAAAVTAYRALKVVGTGSFGVVYQARVVSTGEIVAIKKVFQDRRYKNRELQIMRMLKHPCVVPVLNAFQTTSKSRQDRQEETHLNLVMPYVGETVYRVMKHFAKHRLLLPPLVVKLFAYHICRALAYVHALGICHRDIKPQNLLVDPKTYSLYLCDFGSAKLLQPREPNVAYICSRFYRAPELIFGATDYTNSVDTWSMGCVLAETLLGHPIFRGETGVDQLVEIIKARQQRWRRR